MIYLDLMKADAFLASQIPAVEDAVPAGVKAGAEIIRDEIKREMGVYQDEAGPFEAWQELARRTKRERVALGFTENDPLRRSGELAASVGERSEGNRASIGSDDPVAVWQERGTERIPPRAAIGGSAFRKEHEVVDLIAARVVWAMRGLPRRND